MKKVVSLFISLVFIVTLSTYSASAATTPKLSGSLANGVLTVTVTGVDADKYPQVNIVAVNNTAKSPDLDASTGKVAATVGTIVVGQDNNAIKFAARKGQDYTVMATLKNADGTDGDALFPIRVKTAVKTVIGVSYNVHLVSVGWLAAVSNGVQSGTNGKKLAVDAVKINLSGNVPKGAKISYKAYVHKKGWQSAVSNGAQAGTGKGQQIEALKLTLSGMTGYQVRYRVFMLKKNWLGWQKAKNGTSVNSAAASGAAGSGLQIQAIEVVVEKA